MRVFYKSGQMPLRQLYVAFHRDLTDIAVHVVDEKLQCVTNNSRAIKVLVEQCKWTVVENLADGFCLLEHEPLSRTALLQNMADAFHGIDVVDF